MLLTTIVAVITRILFTLYEQANVPMQPYPMECLCNIDTVQTMEYIWRMYFSDRYEHLLFMDSVPLKTEESEGHNFSHFVYFIYYMFMLYLIQGASIGIHGLSCLLYSNSCCELDLIKKVTDLMTLNVLHDWSRDSNLHHPTASQITHHYDDPHGKKPQII